MKLVHFSDAHVQLRGWRRRALDELGPLRALATVELWKGRGRLFDGAEETLRRIVEQSRKRSAVYDVLTNGTPVHVDVVTG